MKKLLLLIVFVFIGCSNESCDDKVNKLAKQYEKDLASGNYEIQDLT